MVKLSNLAFGDYTITASYSGYNSGTATKEISVVSPDASVLIALGTTTNVLVGRGGGGGGGGGGGSGTVVVVVSDGETANKPDDVTAVTDDATPEEKQEEEPDEADASILDKVNHYAYISGYPDGTARPKSNITRAEAATLFFNLLKQEVLASIWSNTNHYSDVAYANQLQSRW